MSDVPIVWVRGERHLPPGDYCRHGCGHAPTMVVARSDDPERRELLECLADINKGGCGGGCRAWSDGRGRITTAWLDHATSPRSSR